MIYIYIYGAHRCKGKDATCGPSPCISFTGEFRKMRKERQLNYGIVYRFDGTVIPQ